MESDEEKPSKQMLDEWHKDPSNWIFGVFYFNKKDKRIFPPKKLEFLGWTVNFANPYSLIMMLLIVILAVIGYLI